MLREGECVFLRDDPPNWLSNFKGFQHAYIHIYAHMHIYAILMNSADCIYVFMHLYVYMCSNNNNKRKGGDEFQRKWEGCLGLIGKSMGKVEAREEKQTMIYLYFNWN